MKKIIYYILTIIIIIIILPMIIVKSCSINVIGHQQKDINFDFDRDNGVTNQRDIINSTDNIIGTKESDQNQKADIRIKVLFDNDKKIKELDLEEYVIGVVAAEMPAEFEIEALKAQAITARTYAYGRTVGMYKNKDDVHGTADVCTNFAHCQAWVSKDEAMEKWKSNSAEALWNKIVDCVKDTEGLIIVYDGIITNPVFHSNSGGKTENIEDVWDVSPVAYLKSVESKGEETSPSYKTISTFSIQSFCKTLKSCYPNIKFNEKDILNDIKILEYTEGKRVKTIKIGSLTFKGTDIRNIFLLKSANFELEKDEKGNIIITTYGYGHGVGMSQWGANTMAKNGATYEEIIKHYYIGVDVVER